MPRILLRAPKDPFTPIAPELALALYPEGVFARNVGNLVFADAMHRLLSVPGTDVVPNSYLSERDGADREYAARINAEFDAFVIPLANAFRPKFLPSLTNLTRVIEQLTIPVVVTGVGVQGGVRSLEQPIPDSSDELNGAVRRFVSAVLERSATLGVRGDFTREYLARLGFGDEHVEVIGCPSLFRNGDTLQVTKRAAEITPDSTFTMNLSPYVPVMAAASVRHARKYPNMVYIPQGHDTLSLLLWGHGGRRYSDRDIPAHPDHPLYRSNRMRFFVDSSTWIRYLSEQQFSWGSRIHGNIVALSAGTPAHVLAHDSRTLELARYHDIPHTLVPDLAEDFDAADLYRGSDYSAFNSGHAPRFARFASFLERNGLQHVYQDGKANPGYDERLQDVSFPAPVETLLSSSAEAQAALAARATRLHRAAGDKALLAAYEVHHPFPLVPEKPSAKAITRRKATRPGRGLAGLPARLRKAADGFRSA